MQNDRDSTEVPGVLGLGQATATNISNAFSFFSFIAPLPFAILSDARIGRYKTLCISYMLVTRTFHMRVEVDHRQPKYMWVCGALRHITSSGNPSFYQDFWIGAWYGPARFGNWGYQGHSLTLYR